MLFNTFGQYVVLVLCLIAGWIFGLASASGGRTWKRRHHEEEAAHLAYRKDTDARLAASDARVRDLERELEQERAGRRTMAPGDVATGGVAGARVAHRTVAADSAAPADTSWRGWFGGSRDDLTHIRGIDEHRARGLTHLGVRSFADLQHMDFEEEREVENRLDLAPGTIQREEWREQAAMLARGATDDHRTRYHR